jgi:hypothetical protein
MVRASVSKLLDDFFVYSTLVMDSESFLISCGIVLFLVVLWPFYPIGERFLIVDVDQ